MSFYNRTHWLAPIILAILLFASCSSSTSNKEDDITAPAVPSNLEITEIGNGSVTLTWKKVSDESLKGYYVYWLGGGDVDRLNANKEFVNTNSITIENLDYETEYFFAVSSIDTSENESALSVQTSGSPYNTLRPDQPTGLDIIAQNIDFPKITVYWGENSDPDIAAYKLYRSETLAGLSSEEAYLITLVQLNYVDIEVEVGKEYFYRITAVDKGGLESIPSDTVSDYVLSKVTLIAPLSYEYTSSTPTFSWNAVTGAQEYNLVLTESMIGGEIWNVKIQSPDTNIVYNGTKLKSGNTYYWKLGAISKDEINSISDVGTFVVK